MDDPLISVVMPVYNAELWLDRAIGSVLSQTDAPLELIIVDDASTDGSRRIAQQAACVDARVTLLPRDVNGGSAKAMNDGVRYARGRYISRMDADDSSVPGWLARQLDFMEKNPSVGVLGGWMLRQRRNGSSKVKRYPRDSQSLKLMLFFESCFSHPTVMFRRECLDGRVGPYSEDLVTAEDYDLWISLATRWEFHCLQEVGLVRYEHSANLTHIYRAQGVHRGNVRKGLIKLFSAYGLNPSVVDFHMNILSPSPLFHARPERVDDHLQRIFELFPLAQNCLAIRRKVIGNLLRRPLYALRHILGS